MKKKLAFVDLTNFHDWPMGGMLEYELAILPELEKSFNIELWGVSVDGVAPNPIILNNKLYPINIYANCVTHGRIIPNYLKGLFTYKFTNLFNDSYDVVYAHTGSCIAGLLPKIRKDIKLIYHQHGLNYKKDYSIMQSIQRPFFNLAQTHSDITFVVSDEESVLSYSTGKKRPSSYIAIGSPVNVSKFDKIKIAKRLKDRQGSQATKFIYTGRLSAFKNVKLLVKAFALYVNNGHNTALFRIVGSGEEYELLNSIACELGIQSNLILLGNIPHDDVYNLLEDSDVFLTASGGEGWSVSVLEAFAAGLPVICGMVPGLEKEVVDRHTGLFVDKMSAEDFYVKICEINKIKDALANNCLAEAERFDIKVIGNKIITTILSLFNSI